MGPWELGTNLEGTRPIIPPALLSPIRLRPSGTVRLIEGQATYLTSKTLIDWQQRSILAWSCAATPALLWYNGAKALAEAEAEADQVTRRARLLCLSVSDPTQPQPSPPSCNQYRRKQGQRQSSVSASRRFRGQRTHRVDEYRSPLCPAQ